MSSENHDPWLDCVLSGGREGSLMARALFKLCKRFDALEEATARTVKESLTAAPGGPLPEPPSLSDYEARNLFLGGAQGSYEGTAACARRIHRIGWDAAMAAHGPQPQQQESRLGDAATAANVPLVQQMAGKISAGGGATNLSIEVLLIVADWLESQGCISGVCSLRAEAHRAMADWRRRSSNG